MPPRFFTSRPLLARVCVALIATASFLVVLEGTLRLSGFEFRLHPRDIEFGQPDPVLLEDAFRADPDLFWVTPRYYEKLEILARERPPLLLLGDSCTHLVRWDEALASWAEETLGGTLRYGNLAVAGWSSYQGRRQMERDVAGLSPRVVTVYFGWNDHWVGFGFEDEEAARWQRLGASRAGRLRLVQLVLRARIALGDRPNRVPLSDFRRNLAAIVDQARRLDAVPVLLTAPADHRRGEEPSYLASRWLRDLDDLVPVHERYVHAVREVARETGAPLCDLAAAVDGLAPEVREGLFQDDGIHPTPEGARFLATEIASCFRTRGLWPRLLGDLP